MPWETLEKGESMKKFMLYNASGHPISQDGVEVVGDYGNVVAEMTTTSILEVAGAIAEAAAPFVAKGAAVALPGMTILAVVALAKLHGIVGFWPAVAFATRVERTFVWSEDNVLDLHEVRTEARKLR